MLLHSSIVLKKGHSCWNFLLTFWIFKLLVAAKCWVEQELPPASTTSKMLTSYCTSSSGSSSRSTHRILCNGLQNGELKSKCGTRCTILPLCNGRIGLLRGPCDKCESAWDYAQCASSPNTHDAASEEERLDLHVIQRRVCGLLHTCVDEDS